jgi:hypothetical protein
VRQYQGSKQERSFGPRATTGGSDATRYAAHAGPTAVQACKERRGRNTLGTLNALTEIVILYHWLTLPNIPHFKLVGKLKRSFTIIPSHKARKQIRCGATGYNNVRRLPCI